MLSRRTMIRSVVAGFAAVLSPLTHLLGRDNVTQEAVGYDFDGTIKPISDLSFCKCELQLHCEDSVITISYSNREKAHYAARNLIDYGIYFDGGASGTSGTYQVSRVDVTRVLSDGNGMKTEYARYLSTCRDQDGTPIPALMTYDWVPLHESSVGGV